MGNPPFEDVSPILKWWFSIAMLVYRRVSEALGGILSHDIKFRLPRLIPPMPVPPPKLVLRRLLSKKLHHDTSKAKQVLL